MYTAITLASYIAVHTRAYDSSNATHSDHDSVQVNSLASVRRQSADFLASKLNDPVPITIN